MCHIIARVFDEVLYQKGLTRKDMGIRCFLWGKRYFYPMYSLPWWFMVITQASIALFAVWGIIAGIILLGG